MGVVFAVDQSPGSGLCGFNVYQSNLLSSTGAKRMIFLCARECTYLNMSIPVRLPHVLKALDPDFTVCESSYLPKSYGFSVRADLSLFDGEMVFLSPVQGSRKSLREKAYLNMGFGDGVFSEGDLRDFNNLLPEHVSFDEFCVSSKYTPLLLKNHAIERGLNQGDSIHVVTESDSFQFSFCELTGDPFTHLMYSGFLDDGSRVLVRTSPELVDDSVVFYSLSGDITRIETGRLRMYVS